MYEICERGDKRELHGVMASGDGAADAGLVREISKTSQTSNQAGGDRMVHKLRNRCADGLRLCRFGLSEICNAVQKMASKAGSFQAYHFCKCGITRQARANLVSACFIARLSTAGVLQNKAQKAAYELCAKSAPAGTMGGVI